MTLITGDTHGKFRRFWKKNMRSSPDYVIVLGDFGLIFSEACMKQQIHETNFLSQCSFEIIAVLGNHENYDKIYKLPVVERYGNPVYKYTENIYYLQNGYDYRIDGKHYFVYGGATSMDMYCRTTGINHWLEEVPPVAIEKRAMETIRKYNGVFDYCLTHTAPVGIIKSLGLNYKFCPVAHFLTHIVEELHCYGHLFGHFHEDMNLTYYGDRKYYAVSERMLRVPEKAGGILNV